MATDIQLIVYPLIIGFILDAIFGDPYSWPHPIKLFGHLISRFEKRLNNGEHKVIYGGITVALLLMFVFLFFALLSFILQINTVLNIVVSSVFVFYGLANHMLILEAMKVETVLSNDGLAAGRKQLSYIVGRDTSQLTPQQIRTAVLETMAENLSDGVVAPLFYYAIGGIPAMFLYKMVNTLDSMIGYKTERYKDFGFVAAKVDDVANYIPARITAVLIALVGFSGRGFSFIFRFGNKHASPNAGYPESAMAGVLDCRFGGPNRYHGELLDKPFIGTNPREVNGADIRRACVINGSVAVVSVGLIVVCYLLL